MSDSISFKGVVKTLAGSSEGFQDGIGTSSMFNRPCGIVLDINKNIFVADWGNYRIRKITPEGIHPDFSRVN
jgi:hypothetical protein